MKKLLFTLTLLLALCPLSEAQLLKKLKSSVQRTAENEMDKKAKQKTRELMNPDDKKEKSTAAKAENTAKEEMIQQEEFERKEGQIGRKRTDFIAGETTIFVDSLKRELLGEFPSKWDLVTGSVETMGFEGRNAIGILKSGSKIKPLMEEETYLPERFTIQMEVYFHDYGNEGYYIYLEGAKRTTIRISQDYLKYNRESLIRSKTKQGVGWSKVELSFNKRALKVYLNEERLINVPNLQHPPTHVHFGALSHGASKDKYALLRHVRIAEGGVPLYNRLISDGKLVINDLYFAHNEATLLPSSEKTIAAIAKMLNQHEELQVRIDGHTDKDGDDSYNLALSQKRAEAVKIALIDLGIATNRLATKGFGETQPVADNTSQEGKAKNRRVELILLD